jgi:hypothetical protein
VIQCRQVNHADLGQVDDNRTLDMRKAPAATEARRVNQPTTKKEPSVATLPTAGNEGQMHACQLADIHRRIANIRAAYPADEQTLDEAKAVLATLSAIVRVRQGDGSLRVAVTIAYPNLGERTSVWDVR